MRRNTVQTTQLVNAVQTETGTTYVPQLVTISNLGIQFSASATKADFEKALDTIRFSDSSLNWQIGDALLAGEGFGFSIKEIADKLGKAVSTISNMKSTAKIWKLADRVAPDVLSFSHHQTISNYYGMGDEDKKDATAADKKANAKKREELRAKRLHWQKRAIAEKLSAANLKGLVFDEWTAWNIAQHPKGLHPGGSSDKPKDGSGVVTPGMKAATENGVAGKPETAKVTDSSGSVVQSADTNAVKTDTTPTSGKTEGRSIILSPAYSARIYAVMAGLGISQTQFENVYLAQTLHLAETALAAQLQKKADEAKFAAAENAAKAKRTGTARKPDGLDKMQMTDSEQAKLRASLAEMSADLKTIEALEDGATVSADTPPVKAAPKPRKSSAASATAQRMSKIETGS